MTEDKLSIVVVSTDSYSDLWPDFFKCLKDYWPDCPYKIYLVNNILDPDFDGVEVINSGENAQWSERTRNALHKIPTKYVCCLLEDFFISEKLIRQLSRKLLTSWKRKDFFITKYCHFLNSLPKTINQFHIYRPSLRHIVME